MAKENMVFEDFQLSKDFIEETKKRGIFTLIVPLDSLDINDVLGLPVEGEDTAFFKVIEKFARPSRTEMCILKFLVVCKC